jgi:hypothetical protein
MAVKKGSDTVLRVHLGICISKKVNTVYRTDSDLFLYDGPNFRILAY